MKKINKLISLILVLASLMSVFAVFAFADDTYTPDTDTSTDVAPDEDESKEDEKPTIDLSAVELLYRRNFQEGWDYTNGFSAMGNHKAYIDYEETVTRKYNYFWRFEATTSTSAGLSTISLTDSLRESGTVIGFKIKADDACDMGGRILYLTTHGGDATALLYIDGTSLYAFRSGNPDYKLAELEDEWLSINIVFDWDATTDNNGETIPLFRSRIYYGDEGAYIDYESNYLKPGDSGWKSMTFTVPASTKDREGMSYCIDDLYLYNRSKEIYDMTEVEDYGNKINHLADPVIDIQDGPGKKSREEIISEALCMKVRVNTALINNVKQNISKDYCAPEIIDGEVMVPLLLLVDFMGYDKPYVHGLSYDITTGTSATYITIGRDTANVGAERVNLTAAPAYLNGVPVVAAKDIPALFPGWLMNYDDMGLIIVYAGDATESDAPLFTREKDLDEMLDIMKRFVFDIVTKDENGNDFEVIEDSYRATGEAVLKDFEKNAASHPYIFVRQETFDALKSDYLSAEGNAEKKIYLSKLVKEAEDIFEEYAITNTSGNYDGLNPDKKPANVYGDGKAPDPANPQDTTVPDTADGYTPAGTMESVKIYSELLVKLAFAYQITGDEKYADLAYDISIALGGWTHWGPADVANCAAAVGNFTVAYDWLYNYYMTKDDGEARVNALATIIYEKAVKHGYNASFGKPCEFPKATGGGDVYNTLDNYVNVVSSANMIIGALALSEYAEYKTLCADLIGNNLQNLIANGLDQYAPDGSYAESAVVWADATNGFLKLIMALESAIGTTYGFEDTWGIDKTFYYAYYIEDSDGNIWNYHEGGPDGVTTGELLSVDTQMFNYAGKFLSDSTLLAIRKQQLGKGKAVTVFDMLFYPDGDVSFEKELALDYYMEGIDAFVSRSDWNEGALYTGLMGGSNSIQGAQLDSGNFIYRNKGINWIIDLGSDNEEIYSYYGAYRYHHYRHNAEGQNVIVVNTAQDAIPYGQLETGSGAITGTFANAYGGYALLQNKSAYGSTVTFANRGIFVTNNRNTVVIQDEMSFTKFQEAYWIAHTTADIYVPEGGKVAYLTQTDDEGNEYTLRATIVSRSDFRFTYDEKVENGKLSATYKKADYDKNGGIQPYSRTGIKRLIISAKNILTFNLAVVFEIVDPIAEEPVGYSWENMSSWVPVEKAEGVGGTKLEREDAVKQDIATSATAVEMYVYNGTAYTKELDDFYKSLARIAFTLKTFPESTHDTAALQDGYATYKFYLNVYNKYSGTVNGALAANNNLIRSISGMSS